MKTVRVSLAIASGVLLALGWAASKTDPPHEPRILVGLLMGGGMAVTMITGSARISKNNIWFLVAPLLLVLVIYQAMKGTLTEAIVTAYVSVAYLGIQVAFASLPADASSTSATDKGTATPSSEG